MARTNEVVRSGVPLARSLDVKSVAGLAVVDASGQTVPAEFKVTARWNGSKNDASLPIQWLLIGFPATVGANSTATYRLVTDGSAGPNPAPAQPVTLTRNGSAVTVDTGAAIFRLGAGSGALFDEVVLDNGTRLIGGGKLSIKSGGSEWGHSTTRKVTIEHQGPLSAVVVVQGTYDMPAVGTGQVSTRRRYVFTAGSPTAVVRHVANWEGNLGCNACVTTSTGAVNGVLIERLRDELAVELGGTPTVSAVGNFGAPAVTGSVGAAEGAWVRQQLRPSRKSPLAFDVNVAGTAASGVKADGGLLAASGPAGTVAISLNHMHRYEPQALRLLPGGNVAIDVVDDKTWLASRQGLFATLAVTAVAGAPSRTELNRLTWAPLNRPLHAWPQAEWFASSEAVDEFPVGPLPADLASYDTLVSSVLNTTVQKIDSVGLSGLTTFGLYPRYWGENGYDGEVDCGADGSGDPTPGEAWDNLFWCGAWTDYHNSSATSAIWALRTGDVEWLDELSFPAALRTLHSQIQQCSPTEKWFYCGQAPAGYGAYRTDFNSSHAYFENLYLYYWLTGDATVMDILQRGADSMRRYMCSTRGPGPVLEPTSPGGPACSPTDPIREGTVTGRVGQQWLAAFRFIGLASEDATFLEDVRSGFARAMTQLYADPARNGVRYGFWGGPKILSAAGTYTTDSGWTIPMYDMHYLSRLQKDNGDVALGVPGVKPSEVLASVAHTYRDIEPTVIGDGSPSGLWARLLQYTWSGTRLGGTLDNVVGMDRELYNPEKGGAPALLVRAGQQTGEASLVDYGKRTALFMLQQTSKTTPLGKLQGQNLTRLHVAVGLLANGGSAPPPPPPPPSAPVAPSALAADPVSATEIALAWQDNSNNEEQFRIEQMVGGVYQEIRTVGANVTTTRVAGLSASTAYTFRVRASNTAGSSGYSNPASATTQAPPPPPPAPPAAPSALAASAVSGTEIALSWQDNSGNESQFDIEQLVNGAYQQIRTVGTNVTTTRVTGLTPGTSYSFRVRAGNAAGFSGYSNTAIATTTAPAPTTPASPTELTAQAASSSEIVLNWRDNSGNEEQFRIERSVNGAFQEIQTAGANATTARVTGLAAGSTHSFRVRASNASGFSGYSNVASVTTPAPPALPATPGKLNAQAVSATEIQLTWADTSNNETGFEIDQRVGNSFQKLTAVVTNVTTARISGLTPKTSYTFRVRAVNAAGSSSPSNPAKATTLATGAAPPTNSRLAPPSGLKVRHLGGGAVQLTWKDNSSDETQFQVERMVNGTYKAETVVGRNATSARVGGLRTRASYTFRVKVTNDRGQVAYSNTANVNTF
ncbi:MAG TPA: fibronectin type III domain-containing protein [Thermoanaerobaculia bacterium]|nr:fibronectin type III domain-containing protein [Thermoanaerobaculia bacterium]